MNTDIVNRQILIDVITDDGFDYAMVHYSDWNEIEDVEFHELKSSYLKHREELLMYIKRTFDKSNSLELFG